MGAPPGQRARLVALLEPVIVEAGYDLEELSVSQAGRRSLVRVVVDADGGITLDDIATVSRAASAALDDDDGFLGRSPYTLEVTSPGVDRPLTLPRHWSRNVGRLVKVQVGEEHVAGRVTAADDNGVTFDASRLIPYGELGDGKVQVEFARKGADPAGPDAAGPEDTDDDGVDE
jgi:ribosome maturation factor RimP